MMTERYAHAPAVICTPSGAVSVFCIAQKSFDADYTQSSRIPTDAATGLSSCFHQYVSTPLELFHN